MVKISHILGTAIVAVTLLFTFSVTSKADTKPAAIDPVTVYQAKNDGSGFLNDKNYGALSPRVIQLKHQANSADNGKLLMTFEQVITKKAGETGHPVFPIYESDDNGATWKQVGQVTETNNKDWGKLNCPQLYELPQTIGDMTKGTIVVAGDATPNDRSATDLELDKSTDGGKTWTYESTIAKAGGNFLNGDPVWEPYLMVYDNKLVCYYSDERDSSGLPAKSQAIVHQTTTDGKTWSPIVFDANPTKLTNKDQRPGMPIVTQMSNGEWVMTYEQFGGGSSGAKFSKDPLNFDQADPGTTIAPSGAPYITTLNNGELAFNNNGNGGKVFIFKDKASLLRGTYHPDATFTPKSGQAYNRQLLPLANGMLLVANGGGTGNTPNAIKVETLDVGDKSVTIPNDNNDGSSSVTPTPSPIIAQPVMVTYTTTDGTKLRDSQIINGHVGDTYDTTTSNYQVSIDGYTLTKIPDNAKGTLSNASQTVAYVYSKNPTQTNTVPTVTAPTTTTSTPSTSNEPVQTKRAKATKVAKNNYAKTKAIAKKYQAAYKKSRTVDTKAKYLKVYKKAFNNYKKAQSKLAALRHPDIVKKAKAKVSQAKVNYKKAKKAAAKAKCLKAYKAAKVNLDKVYIRYAE